MHIDVRYVNFPKPGAKYGSLRLQDGSYLMCPPDLLGYFRAGSSYDIATKQQTWGQGQDARTVVIVAAPPNQPVQGQHNGGAYGGVVNQNEAQRPNTGFQPRVVQGGRSPSYGQPASGQDRHIFVTGVVGRAMGSGKFAASEIGVLTQAAADAYDRLIGAKPVVQQPVEQPPPEPEQGDPGPQDAPF
ncbi:MAG TPA: hypothetical protein VFB50_19915 [Chloroflexota bacterium]|nr:hypothetical protein [Chloroflexota bacterium]